MSEELKTEELKERFSVAKMLAFVVLTIGLYILSSSVRYLTGTYYWTVTGLFLPYIWVLLLITLLRKANVRISTTTFVTFAAICLILQGYWYYFAGAPEVNFTSNVHNFDGAMIAWVWPEGFREAAQGLVPSWLIPQDEAAVTRYFSGGPGPEPWDVFTTPIAAWTVIFISVIMINTPLTFLLIGPQLWDEERIIFPQTVPFIWTTNEAYAGNLFTFKGTKYKVFWIFFIIGLLLNLPFILSNILPAIPFGAAIIGGGYGQYPLNLDWILQGTFLEGAILTQAFVVYAFMIFLLLPFDFTVSTLIGWLLFPFLYRPLAWRTGIVPAGVYPEWSLPFPYLVVFQIGGLWFGLAFVFLWRARDKVRRMIGSFTKDFDIGGISVRAGTTIMLIGIVLSVAIWTAAGMNPFIAIVFLIVPIILQIGSTVTQSWLGQNSPADCSGQLFLGLFPVGAGLGLWSMSAPQSNATLMVSAIHVSTGSNCWGLLNSDFLLTPTRMAESYSTFKGVKAVNLKLVFLYYLVSVLALIPFALTFNTWFNLHVGLGNTSQLGMDILWFNPIGTALDMGIKNIPSVGTLSVAEFWGYTAFGAVLIVILTYLRATFPWFWLNPIGLAVGTYTTWWIGWASPLLGLIGRFIIVRVLGPRRADELIRPIVAGMAIGIGALYILLGAYIALKVSIPNLGLLWQ